VCSSFSATKSFNMLLQCMLSHQNLIYYLYIEIKKTIKLDGSSSTRGQLLNTTVQNIHTQAAWCISNCSKICRFVYVGNIFLAILCSPIPDFFQCGNIFIPKYFINQIALTHPDCSKILACSPYSKYHTYLFLSLA
jgi:hypothetical protein